MNSSGNDYLIESETVVLERRVGQNDIHDEDYTNKEQRFQLRLTQRPIVEQSRRQALHNRGIDEARQHMHLHRIAMGKRHHGNRHWIRTLKRGEKHLVQGGHADNNHEPSNNPEEHRNEGECDVSTNLCVNKQTICDSNKRDANQTVWRSCDSPVPAVDSYDSIPFPFPQTRPFRSFLPSVGS